MESFDFLNLIRVFFHWDFVLVHIASAGKISKFAKVQRPQSVLKDFSYLFIMKNSKLRRKTKTFGEISSRLSLLPQVKICLAKSNHSFITKRWPSLINFALVISNLELFTVKI